MKICFLKSPTGAFGLGYHTGQTADIDDKQAKELIELGYAEAVGGAKPATNKQVTPTKTLEEMTSDELKALCDSHGIKCKNHKGTRIKALRDAGVDPAAK